MMTGAAVDIVEHGHLDRQHPLDREARARCDGRVDGDFVLHRLQRVRGYCQA